MTSPQLLVIDDDTAHLASLTKIFKRMGVECIAVPRGNEGLSVLNQYSSSISVVLTDLMLPDCDGIELLKEMKRTWPEIEVALMTAYGTIERAVEAMRVGAYDFITKPFRRAEIEQLIRRALERASLIAENRALKEKLAARDQKDALNSWGIIGHSPALRRVLDIAQQAAPSQATILLMGESGTGKEILAQAIHKMSPRKNRPFIAVNCGALPEGVIEAELFGVEKGAFTGAHQARQGRFSRAEGGTLFLDEIGEMPLHLQVRLLRVLQSGEFERVGGQSLLKSDCRIIAATNINLQQAVQEGDFREDLYYRLNVISLTLPPLRSRLDDLPLLAEFFLTRYSQRHQRTLRGFHEQTLICLSRYTWPGNVRELENMIERAVVLCRDEMIMPHDLPMELHNISPYTASDHLHIAIGTPLQEVERRLIHRTLEFTQGDKQKAAQMLGIAARTIYRKLEGSESQQSLKRPSPKS